MTSAHVKYIDFMYGHTNPLESTDKADSDNEHSRNATNHLDLSDKISMDIQCVL